MPILRFDSTDNNLDEKRCTKCGQVYPATTEYFQRDRHKKDGLRPNCKQCKGTQPRLAKAIPDGQKQCSKCGHIHPATLDYFHCEKTHTDGLTSQCKWCRTTFVKDYNSAHHEDVILSKSQHRKTHHKELRDKQKLYYQTERGRIANCTSAHNRRALVRHAEGTHTTEELSQQFQRQKYRCYYCHKKLSSGKRAWHADHIIPLSKGGRNSIDNIVIACSTCNTRKFDKLPHEWIEGGKLL